MNPVINFSSQRPAYLQIADWLDTRIRSGELAADEKLPPERALAAEVGVARGTVKVAYRALEKRGLIRTVPGSGVYINDKREATGFKETREALSMLSAAGLGRTEIEKLVQDCAWSRLKDTERPRLAWVDCCGEMLPPIMREIEVECGFSVQPFLLHQVVKDPAILEKEYYHAVATSIEHYEQLITAAQEVLSRTGTTVERIVLSLTADTVSELAQIGPEERVAIVHDSQPFLDVATRYLTEFGPTTCAEALPADLAQSVLSADTQPFHWVLLPPEQEYRYGLCGRIASLAQQRGARIIHLCHAVDFGSLRALCALARSCY